MCTLAHRHNQGDIVWLSWNGRSQRGGRAKPSFGGQLIAVTVTGARALAAAAAAGELPKTHWDVTLRNWLNSPQGRQSVGASYAYPAVGSFKGHQSQCDPKIGVRNPNWSASWCQKGTRASRVESLPNRHLGSFVTKGLEWIAEIKLPETTPGLLNWKTLRPEEDKAARRWSDWVREHRGAPPLATGWAAHREVLPESAADYSFRSSKRNRRQARAAMVGYAHRIFVDDETQVMTVSNKSTSILPDRISRHHVPHTVCVFCSVICSVSLSPRLWSSLHDASFSGLHAAHVPHHLVLIWPGGRRGPCATSVGRPAAGGRSHVFGSGIQAGP